MIPRSYIYVSSKQSYQETKGQLQTMPSVGFAGNDCHQGLESIVILTIINLILLSLISTVVTIPVWIISKLLRKKILISYQQKVIIVGIFSLIVFELIVNLFALLSQIRPFYQLVFIPGCL